MSSCWGHSFGWPAAAAVAAGAWRTTYAGARAWPHAASFGSWHCCQGRDRRSRALWQRGPRGEVCGRRAGGPIPSTASGARTAVGRQERHGLRRAGHLCRRGQWYRRCQGSKPKATSCGLWHEHGPATRLSRSWFCCGSWQRRRWRMRPLPARGARESKAEPWPDSRGAAWHARRGYSVPRCQLRCRWRSGMWTSAGRAQFKGIRWPRCVATHTPGRRTGTARFPQGGAHAAGANRRGFEALVTMG